MKWLLRYASHECVELDPTMPVDLALRSQFSPAAWRLICRSGKAPFLPILRHQRLGFRDLQLYAEQLVEHSWTQAPPAYLLSWMLREYHLYYNRCTRVPDSARDYHLMWVCQRAGRVGKADFSLVNNWADQVDLDISRRHQWPNLLARARQWQRHEQLLAAEASAKRWHFYCGSVDWRGLQIIPLTTPLALWEEGQAMHSCLYKLRWLCKPDSGSRYFRVLRHGKRLVTLELKHREPQKDFTGMDRVTGRWELLDCRLSFNRLPEAELIRQLKAFAWQYTVWSHRPSRACPRPPVALSFRNSVQYQRRFA